MCPHNSNEFQGKDHCLRRAAELEKILHLEREALISESFREYEELLTRKEKLLKDLFDSIEVIFPRFSEEDKSIVEDELRRLQQINRGNMFLLHSSKLLYDNISHVMGLESASEEENPYQKSKKGFKGRQCLLDGQA